MRSALALLLSEAKGELRFYKNEVLKDVLYYGSRDYTYSNFHVPNCTGGWFCVCAPMNFSIQIMSYHVPNL